MTVPLGAGFDESEGELSVTDVGISPGPFGTEMGRSEPVLRRDSTVVGCADGGEFVTVEIAAPPAAERAAGRDLRVRWSDGRREGEVVLPFEVQLCGSSLPPPCPRVDW